MLRARGVTLLGISLDEPAESRGFARDYEIGFPLLSDPGGAVSKAYVGLDDNDTSVPGIVVIRPDGRIVFRQIATGKADRLTAADVVAAVDRGLGTGAGAPAVRSGYAVLERLQVRLDLGGGAVRVADEWQASAVGSLAVLYPLGRRVLVGPWVRALQVDALSLDVAGALVLRQPILADAAALQLTVTGGWTPLGGDGANAAARLGAWVALNPAWALQLDVGAGALNVASDGRAPELFATLGLTRLIELR